MYFRIYLVAEVRLEVNFVPSYYTYFTIIVSCQKKPPSHSLVIEANGHIMIELRNNELTIELS